MTAGHFLALWQAETQKLLSRTSARGGIVVLMLVGIAVPAFMQLVANVGGQVNGTPTSELVTQTIPSALSGVLTMRNFWITRFLITLLAALSFAEELNSRTLREQLIGPVPRSAVLLAKWLALSVWIGIATLMMWVIGGVFSALLFSADGDWQPLLLAWGASMACDMVFAALALCIAVWVRSTAVTIVGVLCFLIADTLLGWTLTALGMLAGVMELPEAADTLLAVQPWLPSAAFGWWSSWNGGEPWVWPNLVSMGLILLASGLLAERRFDRMDLP